MASTKCEQHGLHYDPARASGCALCLRDHAAAARARRGPIVKLAVALPLLGLSTFASYMLVDHYLSAPKTVASATPEETPEEFTERLRAGGSGEPRWEPVARELLVPDAVELAGTEHLGFFRAPDLFRMPASGETFSGRRPTDDQVREAAKRVSHILGVYPDGVLHEVGVRRIIFCLEMRRGNDRGAGFAVREARTIFVDVDLFDWSHVEWTLHHELFHMMDGRPPDRAWSALNSPGFAYGPRPETTPDFDPNLSGFVTAYILHRRQGRALRRPHGWSGAGDGTREHGWRVGRESAAPEDPRRRRRPPTRRGVLGIETLSVRSRDAHSPRCGDLTAPNAHGRARVAGSAAPVRRIRLLARRGRAASCRNASKDSEVVGHEAAARTPLDPPSRALARVSDWSPWASAGHESA